LRRRSEVLNRSVLMAQTSLLRVPDPDVHGSILPCEEFTIDKET